MCHEFHTISRLPFNVTWSMVKVILFTIHIYISPLIVIISLLHGEQWVFITASSLIIARRLVHVYTYYNQISFASCSLTVSMNQPVLYDSVGSWEQQFDSAYYCLQSDGHRNIFAGTSRHGSVDLWDKRQTKSPVKVGSVKVTCKPSITCLVKLPSSVKVSFQHL